VIEDRSIFEITEAPSLEVISYGDNADQLIEVFRSRERCWAKVLLVHGGYWRPEYDRSHLRPYAAKLSSHGFDVYLLEYRRTPGAAHNYFEDLFTALDSVGKCALVGHSAGGQLALLAATHPAAQSIVALAPVSDLVEGDRLNLDEGAIRNFLGGDPERYLHLNPSSVVRYPVPVTVIHGDADQRVPVELSRRFAEKYPHTRYCELRDIGHFELIDPRKESIFEIVVNTLMRG